MKISFPEMENLPTIVIIHPYIISLKPVLTKYKISMSFFLSSGELYSATSNEPIFGVTDSLIQRSFSQGKQLRTQQHDSNWLKSK
jgi:hypothetical protein